MFRVLHGLPAVLLLSWYAQAVPAAPSPSVEPEALVSESRDSLPTPSPNHGSDESRFADYALIDASDDEPPVDWAAIHLYEFLSRGRREDIVLAVQPPPAAGGGQSRDLAAVYLLTERFRL